MPTQTLFQCHHCLHALGLPDKLVGRRIRCPMCGEPLTVPAPDAARHFRKQDLGQAIEKFALTEWDRAFARTLRQEKTVPDKTLYKALVAVIKAAKKGSTVGLGAELRNAEAIDGETCDRIRALVRGTVKSTKEAFVECPNCFARISDKARACKFCGQAMGDVSTAICPNCKHEQPSSLPRCRRCMADMKTGLREGVEICPGCNQPLMGAPEVCPHCKARLREPARRKRDRSDNRRVMRRKLLAAGAVAGVILILLLYGPICTLVRYATVGAAQAMLEGRVRDFGTALQDNVPDAIAAFVDPDTDLPVDEDMRTRLLLADDRQACVTRVKTVSIAAVQLNDEENRAEVRVQAALRVGAKGLEAAGTRRIVGGGRRRSVDVTWQWIRRDGTWYVMPEPADRGPR